MVALVVIYKKIKANMSSFRKCLYLVASKGRAKKDTTREQCMLLPPNGIIERKQ